MKTICISNSLSQLGHVLTYLNVPSLCVVLIFHVVDVPGMEHVYTFLDVFLDV